MGAELARGVVREILVEPPEPGVEAAAIVEVDEELADVPGRVGDEAGVLVVDVEHLVVLGLDRVRARGRGADDPVALPGVLGERLDVAARVVARLVVEAVADHREPAADLRRDDRLEAVPAEDLHRGVRHVLLVVVGGAAVEVDDRLVRARDAPGCRGASGAASRSTGASSSRTWGTARARWIPIVFSMANRIGPKKSAQLAIGRKRTPIRPTRSVWARPQSRSFGRWPAFMRAREREFISAILTPAGQEVVHHPQPEHQSTVRSGVSGMMFPFAAAGCILSVRKRWA